MLINKFMADEEPGNVELDEHVKPTVPKETVSEGDKLTPKESEEENEEDVVPVRSAMQHIIARKNRTIEKLRSRTDEEEVEGATPADKNATPADENDDLTPEARSAVERAVHRQVAPLIKGLVSKADEDELQELFHDEPEAKTLEKRIRAYMNHEQYQGVPPSVIYHHLAFSKARGDGTLKRKTADTDAALQRGGGSPIRPSAPTEGGVPTIEELDAMDEIEFEAVQEKARQGGYVSDK